LLPGLHRHDNEPTLPAPLAKVDIDELLSLDQGVASVTLKDLAGTDRSIRLRAVAGDQDLVAVKDSFSCS